MINVENITKRYRTLTAIEKVTFTVKKPDSTKRTEEALSFLELTMFTIHQTLHEK